MSNILKYFNTRNSYELSFFREGDPLALNYFKIIRIFMVAPGAWPADVFGEKLSLLVRVHRALMPYHTSVIVIGELYYLYIHKEELDFLNMGHMIIFTFLAVLIAEILKHKGNEDISSEMFDAEENRAVRLKLQECIEHHKLIIGFTDELSELFGPILAINYFFHLVCCSLLLLECSEGGAWIRYGPLTVVIYGQLIQMSVIFEMLGSETEKLPDSAYFLPWECMDTSNRRTACIMLHKMQYKISLKALGLAAVGVSTMTGILKTTFSYYAFLQTRDEWEIRKTF
ncbi:uncharacterized protein LOC114362599 isoform X5 [Ostrinia furnacalis]|uniref:uncharacterized protein LOC114362599 isoform X5 n=1 Tax=Ostrinia furnacalis TaxID=93504 RepID=UPI00103E59BF|nr:uncharacterized protein LOC114362599 isoform X5 [Ostrinia furnacalis]